MQSIYPPGYQEAILDSDEDYEPYGFLAARLAEIQPSPQKTLRQREVERAALFDYPFD